MISGFKYQYVLFCNHSGIISKIFQYLIFLCELMYTTKISLVRTINAKNIFCLSCEMVVTESLLRIKLYNAFIWTQSCLVHKPQFHFCLLELPYLSCVMSKKMSYSLNKIFILHEWRLTYEYFPLKISYAESQAYFKTLDVNKLDKGFVWVVGAIQFPILRWNKKSKADSFLSSFYLSTGIYFFAHKIYASLHQNSSTWFIHNYCSYDSHSIL